MWKKAVPAIALSAFLLVGCNVNDNAAPNNDETPMEEVGEDVNDLVPDMNDLTPDVNDNNGNGMNGIGGTNTNESGYNGGAGDNGLDDVVPNENKGINEDLVPDANNDTGQTMQQEIKELTK